MPAIPLPKQSNPQEFRENGDERLINCFAEKIDEARIRIRRTPGFTLASEDATAFKCRGAIEADGYIYAVFAGGTVAKIDSDGARTTLTGSIGGSGYVSMARNGAAPFQIGVVVPDNGKYYVIESDAITIVDTRDIGAFNSIAWLSGYFFLGMPDGRVFNADFNDAKTVNGLSYFTAESNPDGLTCVFESRNELVVVGTRSVEFWGIDTSPPANGSVATRLGAAIIPKGSLSPNSFANFDNSFCFVGSDGRVYRNMNYSFQRISHYGVERAINAESDITAIRGASYAIGGNEFYRITGDGFTWVFNAASGLWHEEQSYNSDRSKADTFVQAWNGVFCLTKYDGNLYQIDDSVTTENGDPLVVTARFPDVPSNIIYSAFELDIVTGRAPLSGASNVVEPSIEITWSDDGGATWANPRIYSLGTEGEYNVRIRALRLGKPRYRKNGRRFEVTISDPHVVSITGATVNEVV